MKARSTQGMNSGDAQMLTEMYRTLSTTSGWFVPGCGLMLPLFYCVVKSSRRCCAGRDALGSPEMHTASHIPVLQSPSAGGLLVIRAPCLQSWVGNRELPLLLLVVLPAGQKALLCQSTLRRDCTGQERRTTDQSRRWSVSICRARVSEQWMEMFRSLGFGLRK